MKRFWKFAMWFTGFGVFYGTGSLLYSLTSQQGFNDQAFYLIIGMFVIFSKARAEYRASE